LVGAGSSSESIARAFIFAKGSSSSESPPFLPPLPPFLAALAAFLSFFAATGAGASSSSLPSRSCLDFRKAS